MNGVGAGIAKLDPEIKFGICTNGSLVHGERFAWIVDQNIGLTLSYDGKGQHLRGTDVLRDPATADNLKQLFRERPDDTSISAVVSKASGSPEDIIKYTSELLEVDKPSFGVTDHIMVVDKYSQSCALSSEELQQYALSLHKALITGEVQNLQSCRGAALRFVENINKRALIPDGQTRCFVSSDQTVSIDLDGNILPCQGYGAKDLIREGVTYGCGNIFAGEEIRDPDLTQLTERQQTRCSKCVMRQLCGGGCPYGPKEYEDYNCAANFAMSLPALGLAMHMLTGGILEEIREA